MNMKKNGVASAMPFLRFAASFFFASTFCADNLKNN